VTRTDGWLQRRKENGRVASEPCPRSEWLLHGRDPARIQPDTRTRRKCCPRRRAPLGSSECIDRSKPYLKPKNSGELRRCDGLTNKSPYKAPSVGRPITDLSSVTTVGLDLAKHVFQVHGVDASGRVVVAKSIRYNKLLEFFASLPPCLVGLEASGSAHHWARELAGERLFLLRRVQQCPNGFSHIQLDNKRPLMEKKHGPPCPPYPTGSTRKPKHHLTSWRAHSAGTNLSTNLSTDVGEFVSTP
jgi:hypothetical protein